MPEPPAFERDNQTPDRELNRFVDVEVVASLEVAGNRRSVLATEFELKDARDDDVLELELESGITIWVSVAQLRKDLNLEVDEDRSGITVPAALPRRGRLSRGASDLFLKGLKLLRLDPTGPVADLAVDVLISQFETKVIPRPGLYLVGPEFVPGSLVDPGSLDNSAPLLIFLHGTASSTEGSFGRLISSEWNDLASQYGNRILALEHHTLSKSPIRNALDLATQLPRGARLHLVSHSRGGLVGELLALAELPDSALDPFRAAGRNVEVAEIQELTSILKDRAFVIERFVRVACPARGSLIVSERLDLYLSLILNIIGQIPFLRANPFYAFIKACTLEFAKRRTQPSELPGLEAMMPSSVLIAMLNGPAASSKADLAVIAGDIQGEGLFGRLKVFATDLYYQTDHDLVVNTSSMYGGPKREKAINFFFDQGSDVNHFSYFANSRTRSPLISWLKGDGNTGFAELTRGQVRTRRRTARVTRSDSPDSTVFLLPDLMASSLSAGRDQVWIDMAAIANGDLLKIRLHSGDQVDAKGLIDDRYQTLIDRLETRDDVRVVPYDWRKSIFDSARILAGTVEAEIASNSRPVRFIGHGMGGLVVQAMIADRPDLWEKVRKRGGRLLMVGTAMRGTWVVPRILLGVERIIRQLSMVDFAHSPTEIGGIFCGFPGLLEQLPFDSDCLDVEWWQRRTRARPSGSGSPEKAKLIQATTVQDRLKGAIDVDGMLYLAGTSAATPIGIGGTTGEDFLFTASGDGVADDSSRVGLRSWRVQSSHGDLVDSAAAIDVIVDLISTGTTSKLHELTTRSDPASLFEADIDREPLLFPTESELASSAAFARSALPPEMREALDSISISVVHGDLQYARYPVLAGHYQGDMIVSAEAAIDRCLSGKLTERYQASLYPGAIGTAEVVHSPTTSPIGALIVGLGEVGEITPEKVKRGVRAALLRHAFMTLEADAPLTPNSSGEATWRSASFSSLLVGTVGGSSLSIESSLAAVIQGAIQANHALKAQGLWDRVRIDRIEFIELHEDIALAAIRAAHSLTMLPPTELAANETLDVSPSYLVAREGGLFSRPANQYTTGWWRRVQITSATDGKGDEGALNFLTLTDRARAEDRVESTQRRLVDLLVSDAISSSSYDAALCATLYELLIPNLLKDQAGVEANLALILDSASAQYPWELLAERADGKIDPFALRQGLIRQFKVSNFRQSPQGASERNALVVGDTESGLIPLPGAQEEAMIVGGALAGGGFTVAGPLIKPRSLTLINELFARDYRVLHLAAHGDYNQLKPDESGIVLGDGIFLTSKEVEKLRVVPDLVFLNCCYLAITDKPQLNRHFNHLAASLSEQLIRIGVKAIIAAGWAVDDAAAATFSRVFYQSMLEGWNLGDSVLTARRQTAKLHPAVNTWGAYQCYGNPAFTLVNDPMTSTKWSTAYSKREAVDRILKLARTARNTNAERRTGLLQDLRRIVSEMPSFWFDGQALSALGTASAELQDFAAAAEYYGKALIAPGTASLKTVESLVTARVLEARLLSEAARSAEEKNTAARMYQDAEKQIRSLLELGTTVRRLVLYANLSKHFAMEAKAAQRNRHLKEAEDSFKAAMELNSTSTTADRPISAYLIAELETCAFLRKTKAKGPKRLPTGLSAMPKVSPRVSKENARQSNDPFTALLASAHGLLLGAITGAAQEAWEELGALYIATIKSAKTRFQIASIDDHLAFVMAMLEGKPGSKETMERIEEVRKRIQK